MGVWGRLRRIWQEQWGSQGIEAAGAALAAAIVVGALLGVAPSVGRQVTKAMDCAASVLYGSGGSCGGGAAVAGNASAVQPSSDLDNLILVNGEFPQPHGQLVLIQAEAPSSETPTPSSEAPTPDCGWGCQLLGVPRGAFNGAKDTVVGLKDLAVDGYNLVTGDQETRNRYSDLGTALRNDPLGTLGAIGQSIIDPIQQEVRNGRYGDAVGRVIPEVLGTVLGDKGASRIGRLGRVEDVAQSSRAARESIDAARRLGGAIDYGGLDSLGRATGIQATLTPEMIQGGIGSGARQSIRPPGFEGGTAGHARGHLLGRQLGGSGSVESNLVTLYQNPVNTPFMSNIEGRVRAAVEAGETVRYRVTPVYSGDNPMPTRIRIQAQGDRGFEIDQYIDNLPHSRR